MKKLIAFLCLCLSGFCSSSQLSQNTLHFDGLYQYVDIPWNSHYNLGMSDFTIEAMIKAYSNSNEGTILRTMGCGGNGFAFYISRNGKVAFSTSRPGICNEVWFLPPPNLFDSLCHHVAVTGITIGTSRLIRFFIDGIQYNSGTYSGDSIIVSQFNDLYIGLSPILLFSPFNGLIKEVRFWNIARTQGEIQSEMNVVLNLPNPNLIGYWRCSDGNGQTVRDYSMNSNDGILGGNYSSDIFDPTWDVGCRCLPSPTATISTIGATIFCSGDSVTFNANLGTGLNYQWRK